MFLRLVAKDLPGLKFVDPAVNIQFVPGKRCSNSGVNLTEGRESRDRSTQQAHSHRKVTWDQHQESTQLRRPVEYQGCFGFRVVWQFATHDRCRIAAGGRTRLVPCWEKSVVGWPDSRRTCHQLS
jgi:hypothetical protein